MLANTIIEVPVDPNHALHSILVEEAAAALPHDAVVPAPVHHPRGGFLRPPQRGEHSRQANVRDSRLSHEFAAEGFGLEPDHTHCRRR
jgi:hypothetical protein